MPSRKIDDLHPRLQPLCKQFIADCKAAGVNVLITCTYRSNAEQAQLYAQGRTAGGKIVTKAKPGESAHNFTQAGKPAARAFDFVPLDASGLPIWNAEHASWKTAGAVAVRLGLDWGGTWKFKDYPHCELKA